MGYYYYYHFYYFFILLLVILLRTKAAHNMSQLQTPEKTPETKK